MEKKQKIEKKRWEPIKLISMGKIKDIVHSGGGKLTAPYDDPGEEPRKPSGLEIDI